MKIKIEEGTLVEVVTYSTRYIGKVSKSTSKAIVVDRVEYEDIRFEPVGTQRTFSPATWREAGRKGWDCQIVKVFADRFEAVDRWNALKLAEAKEAAQKAMKRMEREAKQEQERTRLADQVAEVRKLIKAGQIDLTIRPGNDGVAMIQAAFEGNCYGQAGRWFLNAYAKVETAFGGPMIGGSVSSMHTSGQTSGSGSFRLSTSELYGAGVDAELNFEDVAEVLIAWQMAAR